MSDSNNGVKAIAARNLVGHDFLVCVDEIASVIPMKTGVRLKGYDGYPLVNIEIAERVTKQRVLRHLVNIVKRRDRGIHIADDELDITGLLPDSDDDVDCEH